MSDPKPGVRQGSGLGPAERLRRRKEFQHLWRTGRRGGDDLVRVLVGRNDLGWSRIASAVSKRYGNAVRRNRLRRLYKEAFRLEKHALPPGYDVVLSPPRGSGEPSLEALRASLVRAVLRLVEQLERRGRRGPAAPPRPPQEQGGDRRA